MGILAVNMGAEFWLSYWDKIKNMALNADFSYIIEFLVLAVTFYLIFKILKENKVGKLIAVIAVAVIAFGFTFSATDKLPSMTLVFLILLAAVCVILMYNTEIKRSVLDSGSKKHVKRDGLTVKDVEFIVDEIIHAVQHMSKQNVGALIVLSNENLPEGIISSGTVINADINTAMIEAVFYPKAPLHDGAMVIEGDKIHAAGCFLPLIQNDNLPQEVGSRHRAALGVTTVASVTSIVVSEETGVISIVRNGEVKKKYASDADLKSALSDYYWTDLNGEEAK